MPPFTKFIHKVRSVIFLTESVAFQGTRLEGHLELPHPEVRSGRVPTPAPLSASEQAAHIRLSELHGKVGGIFICGGERNPVRVSSFRKNRIGAKVQAPRR